MRDKDEERQKIVKQLLKDLKQASKLIDRVSDRASLLKKDLDRSHFILQSAKTLSHIFTLESKLFDLEPSLTHDYLKPSLEPIDLSDA